MNDFHALMAKARQTNRQRDQIDGAAAPKNLPLAMQLGTVSGALEAGIRSEDWSCVAEGLAMLEDVMRGKQ